MLNLLAAFRLTRDYGTLVPIDNPNFANLNTWTLHLGTSISQSAGNFNVEGVFPQNKAQIKSPFLFASIASGQHYRVTCDITVVDPPPGGTRVRVIPRRFNASLPTECASFFVILSTGANSVTMDFDSHGYEFDQIMLDFWCNAQNFFNTQFDTTIPVLTTTDTGLFTDFNNGDRVLTYWDDVAEAIVVYKEDNPGGVQTLITAGPTLVVDDREDVDGVDMPKDPIPRKPFNQSYFRFCDDTTLVLFGITLPEPDFPYAVYYPVPNAPECQIVPVVCDIHFNVEAVVTPASPFQSDGAVQLSAVSSAPGPVRYTAIEGQFYNQANNETGLFTGLHAGLWDFDAIDSNNCRATIGVNILTSVADTPAGDDYGEKYRLQYYDKQTGQQSVIKIMERGFTGDSTEVKGSGEPFFIEKPAGEINNKFEVIRPTTAIFNLVSEKHFAFIGLFSQDDTKYKIEYTHGTTSWVGFIVPSAYEEDYSANVGYVVSLKATDNLFILSEYGFVDSSGNDFTGDYSLMGIIYRILLKTSLELNIISAVNRFATGMDVDGDPLEQTFIETDTFYDDDGNAKNCREVLEDILKPFGAFIQQVDGKWNIIEADSQTSPYGYREFDPFGVGVDYGVINPEQEITTPDDNLQSVVFAERNHTLDIIPAYGQINVIMNMTPRPSLFPISLDEEWQANLANAGGVFARAYDIVGTKNKGMEFTNFRPQPLNNTFFAEFISPDFHTTATSDAIKFEFKYKVLMINESRLGPPASGDRTGWGSQYPTWVRLIWRVRIIIGGQTFYYSERRGWNQEALYKENHIYVKEFSGEDASFSRQIELPNVSPAGGIDIRAEFRMEGSLYVDYNGLAALKAIESDVLPAGTKVRGRIPHADWDFVTGSTPYFFYTLVEGSDAESNPLTELPFIVRPTDYNGGTNQVVWKLDPDSVYNILPTNSFFLSDYRMLYLPNKKDPLTSDTLTIDNNPNFKEILDYNINAGDIPDAILQSEIYSNIFKNEDGTPTDGWTRVDISELRALQYLLLRNITNQFYKPTWRLAGMWMGPDIKMNTILKHYVIPVTLTIIGEESPGVNPAWVQTGSGQGWAPGATCTVEFTDTLMGNSLIMGQTVQNLLAGVRIRTDIRLTRSGTGGIERIDRLICVLKNGTSIIQKVTLVDGINSDNLFERGVSFNVDQDATSIGFMIENIAGDGGFADYSVDYFRGKGVTSVRYFYSNAFQRMDRDNKYQLQLVQLIPKVASTDTDIDDTGGGNTGNNDTGGGIAGRAHSSGFGTGFS